VEFRAVLRNGELLRLDVGIFVVHVVLMALFVVVPLELVRAGLAPKDHWWLYLGVVGAGFVLMLPAVMSHKGTRERTIFIASIAGLAASLAVFLAAPASLATLVVALVIFFGAFNVLEAKLPALVSRAAPPGARGAATGVYSTVQFFGTFVGGALGGFLAQHGGFTAVIAACLALTGVWLAVAWKMGDFAPISLEDEANALDSAGSAPASRT
jgi:predicted MFS family arabinose efflux permease